MEQMEKGKWDWQLVKAVNLLWHSSGTCDFHILFEKNLLNEADFLLFCFIITVQIVPGPISQVCFVPSWEGSPLLSPVSTAHYAATLAFFFCRA